MAMVPCMYFRDDRHQHLDEIKFAHTFSLESLSLLCHVLISFAGHPLSEMGMARNLVKRFYVEKAVRKNYLKTRESWVSCDHARDGLQVG